MVMQKIRKYGGVLILFSVAWSLEVYAHSMQEKPLKVEARSSIKPKAQPTKEKSSLKKWLDKLEFCKTKNKLNSYYYVHETTKMPSTLLANHMDKDTLVVFGVQDVLLRPTDRMFRNWRDWARWSKFFLEDASDFQHILPQGLVDPNMPKLMATFYKNDVKVLAVTNSHTGHQDEIMRRILSNSPRDKVTRNIEDVVIQQLNKAGYNTKYFCKGLPIQDLENTSFSHAGCIPNCYTGYTNPMFKEGVMFSGGSSLPDNLEFFLDTLTWKPKRILFVHPRSNFHAYMAKWALKHKIDSLGILYKKARMDSLRNSSTPLTQAEEDRMKFQMWNLDKTGNWCSDDSADAIIQKTMTVKKWAVVKQDLDTTKRQKRIDIELRNSSDICIRGPN